jgi:hypothetical protein
MSKKNIYEVFDDFRKAKTKKDRIAVLKENETFALVNVLKGTFHPGATYVIKESPNWKKEVNLPPGMGYSNMSQALDKIYLFMENHPRTPPALTEKRKIELLLQVLESLEPKEADVYMGIILKDQKVPHLTEALVNEAFPGLLPQG